MCIDNVLETWLEPSNEIPLFSLDIQALTTKYVVR